jgi:hypothetical protein
MQVNSAQDYTTALKRRIAAKAAVVAPSPQKRKNNTLYTGIVANHATQCQRFIVPIQPVTPATFSSDCCDGSGGTI